MEKKYKERLVGLDIYRVMSALGIFIFHTRNMDSVNYGAFDIVIAMGAVFMTGFFVLSGFSLYYSYGDIDIADSHQIKNFYKKRIFSIIPSYFFVSLLFILVFKRGRDIVNELILAPVELVGMQSWFDSLFKFSHNGGTWFISCLLFAYFIFPLIVALIRDLNVKQIKRVTLIIMLLIMWAPIVTIVFDCSSIYSKPLFRMLEFIIGMLMCVLWNKSDKKRYSAVKLGCVLIISLLIQIILTFKFSFPRDYMFYNVFFLPFFMIAVMIMASLKIRENKVISFMSKISYEFFLAQFFTWGITDYIVKKLLIENILLIVIISFLICFSIATLLHIIVRKIVNTLTHNGKFGINIR